LWLWANQDGIKNGKKRDQNRNEERIGCQEQGRTENKTGHEKLQATDTIQSQKP
jgi:hypothetical protein